MLKKLKQRQSFVAFVLLLCCAMQAFFLSSCRFPPWKKSEAEILFNDGSKLYDEGKYAEAVEKYKQALEKDATNYLTYYYLGQCEYKLHRFKEAKQHLTQVQIMKPESKESQLAGDLIKLIPKEKPPKKTEDVTVMEGLMGDKQITPLDIPKFKREKKSKAYQFFLLGKQYTATGKWNLAIAQYEKALDLDAEYGPLYTDLGIAYAKKGLFDKAVAALQKATQLDRENLVAHYNLGLIYEGKGQLTSAIQEYFAVLTLDPNNVNVRVRLGTAFVLNNQNIAAMDQWNIATTIDPNSKEAHVLLGKIYSDVGEFQFQPIKYTVSYNQSEHVLDYQRTVGTANSNYLYYDAAADEFLKALRLDPHYAEAYYGLGTAYARAAQKDIRLIYTDFKQHRDSYTGAVRLKMTIGEMFDHALENLKKAVSLDPLNPYYLVNLGVVYGETGYYEQAKMYLKRAIQVDPRLTAAYANLAIIYSAQGAIDLAQATYKRIQKIDPAKVRAQDTLSLIQPTETLKSGPGLYTPSATPPVASAPPPAAPATP